jgi:copper chaperone
MIEFEVNNMSCGHCVGSVTKTVKQIDPGADVQVDLPSKKVSVQSSQDRTIFAKALTEAGYPTT